MPVPFPHAGYMNKLWDQVEFVINSVLTGTPWTVESMLDNMVRERVTVGCPRDIDDVRIERDARAFGEHCGQAATQDSKPASISLR